MPTQLTLGLTREPTQRALAEGAALLGGFALADEAALTRDLRGVIERAPFRQMRTPGGLRMSVGMTNCGTLGWVSDGAGYRYVARDPQSGLAWPELPPSFRNLAQRAATQAGFPHFEPDACLINRYQPGTRLTLHQDKNERDFTAPIVSVSLGLPATFLFGGDERSDRAERVPLEHGDVAVWGGPARRRFHGVLPVKAGQHPVFGSVRINLTLRKAG